MTIKKRQKKLPKQGSRFIWLSDCYSIIKLLGSFFKDYILYIAYCVAYRRKGHCKQCGRCCRHVYIRNDGKLIGSFQECLLIAQSDKKLKHFNVKGANEAGELFFACDYIGKDNKCTRYDERPLMCRVYPDISMLRYGAVPKEDCGYYFINRFTRRKVT